MFNPDAKFQAVSITQGDVCYVIDDALISPENWLDYADAHRDQFATAPHNAYPGIELALPERISTMLEVFFRLHIRRHLGARRMLNMHSRLSMATLQPEALSPIQWLCHRDRLGAPETQMAAASVLYLFDDPSLGGTSFYLPKQDRSDTEALMRLAGNASRAEVLANTTIAPSYLLDSNDYFQRVCTVPAKWNRIIFYNGSLFHSPDLRHPAALSEDPRKGRLTLNSFYTCSRAAT